MEKWFFFSDMQMPHHDEKAVDLAFKVLKAYKPDVVVNIGDLADGTGSSRWADGTTEEVFAQAKDEAQGVKDYWAKVRKTLPNARLIWTEGNHDLRPFDYVDKKAPALKELITPESLWELSSYGVEYINYNAPPEVKMGDIYVHHGVAVSKHAGGSVQSDMESFGVSLVRGHCFSEDTEILTKDGWKHHKSLEVGQLVYTMNLDTNVGEWQPIKEKFVYDDFDSMISIKGRNVDLLVTPGHGMVYSTRGVPQKWKLTSAEDLSNLSRHNIPLAVKSSDVDIDYSDDEIRMAAWVVAEGNFDKYVTKSGEKRYRVRICQSDAPDGRLDRLAELFGSLGWCWNPIKRYDAGETDHGTHRNYDAYRICVKREDYNKTMNKLVSNEKILLPHMINMSARQARLYLMEYVWADGCKNSASTNSWQLAGNNYENMSMLQALAVKAGFRSSLIKRPRGMYTLTINSRTNAQLERRNYSTVDYSGKVWCVTVPNHTVVVRRNGKTVITQNSHRMGVYSKTYELRNETIRGYEIGHLMQVDKATYTQVHNWQQGFAVGVNDNGIGHIDLIPIYKDYVCFLGGKRFSV